MLFATDWKANSDLVAEMKFFGNCNLANVV